MLCWHDADALALPDLGDGGLAHKQLRGCAFSPDAAAILSHAVAPAADDKAPSYDASLRTALAEHLEKESTRGQPWPKALADVFFPALSRAETAFKMCVERTRSVESGRGPEDPRRGRRAGDVGVRAGRSERRADRLGRADARRGAGGQQRVVGCHRDHAPTSKNE